MSTQFTQWRWTANEGLGFPPLNNNELHIWRSPLDTSAAVLSQLSAYLSEDEQTRAARFRFDHHRHHFIVGRGILRVLLGRYVQQEPQDVVFAYGDRGKPYLVSPKPRTQASLRTLKSKATESKVTGSKVTGSKAMGSKAMGSRLQFNVSHSGGVALYAIALHRRVGIDLEEIRPMPNAAQLAQRFFTEREYTQLLAQPADQQALAFFRGWTRKEAYLKATGEGLAGLETVEVSLLEDQPRRLEVIQNYPDNASNLNPQLTPPLETQQLTPEWLIHDIPLDSNHRAAVVMEAMAYDPEPLSIGFWELCF